MWSERLLATVTFQVHHSGYGVLAPVAKDLHTLSSRTCYLALFWWPPPGALRCQPNVGTKEEQGGGHDSNLYMKNRSGCSTSETVEYS
mgnify:CR=1 FL=1